MDVKEAGTHRGTMFVTLPQRMCASRRNLKEPAKISMQEKSLQDSPTQLCPQIPIQFLSPRKVSKPAVVLSISLQELWSVGKKLIREEQGEEQGLRAPFST